jgi:hypothetical protein
VKGLAGPDKEKNMRVMVLVKATAESEAGMMPAPEAFEAMGRFNAALAEAGILLAADGLTASAKGKRVAFDGERRTVVDGPFERPEELVAGFWIWKVADLDEAVAWVERCPNPMPGPSVIEIRPLMEFEDLEANFTPEMKETRRRVAETLSGKLGPAGALGGLGR